VENATSTVDTRVTELEKTLITKINSLTVIVKEDKQCIGSLWDRF